MIADKIRQSEIAKELKKNPAEIKELRDKHLSEAEWERVGTYVLWNHDAYLRVKTALSPKEEIKKESPEVFQARTIRACPNKRMLYADIDGTRIAVNCGKFRNKLLKKTIPVTKDAEGETYTYAP